MRGIEYKKGGFYLIDKNVDEHDIEDQLKLVISDYLFQ